MLFAFGNLEIDALRGQLRHAGREVETQPLVFDLLLYFARRPHALVTKEALLRDVWKGVVVSDNAVTQAISMLRRTLREHGGSAACLKTVWGRGYRLVADVAACVGADGIGAARRLEAPAAAVEDGSLRVAARVVRPLVGRRNEREMLAAQLDALATGRGGLIAFAGEPGIGKTRLLEELALDARAAAVRVLWGACWESAGVPAFWPWAQVLRAYAAMADADELRETLDPVRNDVARIVPELGDEGGEPAPSTTATRFTTFDALAALLTRAAARRPLVLVLDDVHAADLASLRLLTFVARTVHTAPLLLAISYRETEVRRRSEIADLLAEVTRDCALHRLGGLDDTEVALFLAARGGGATPEVVAVLQAATGGNPFFLEAIVQTSATEGGLSRLASARGGIGIVPPRAAAVLRGHFDALTPAAQRTLRAAALVGTEFSLSEVGAICAGGAAAILAHVRAAAEEGIVVGDSLTGTRFRFRHALFREVLADEVPPADRALLHRAIGKAIERLYAPHLEPHLDRLAHHFLRGARKGDWRRAVGYAEAAAARASRRMAYEDADAYLEGALDALEIAGADGRERRCELLLALGAARHKAAGLDAARAVLVRAAEAARTLGRPDLLGRAALAFTPWTSYGRADDEGVRLLEEALAAQRATESPLAAALRSRLAYALVGTAGVHSPRVRADLLARDGVDMARRTGDLPALGRALFEARWIDFDPATFGARRTMTAELRTVARDLGDRELAVLGEGWHLVDGLEAGHPLVVDEAMRRHAALANELREPEHRWWGAVWRAMRAIAEGRHQESDGLVTAALELGRQVHPENAALVAYVQYAQVRVDRGELDEALTALEQLVDGRPDVFAGDATIACRRARLLAALGRTVEARQELERIAVDDFRAVAVDLRYADNLAALTVVAAAVGDRPRAATLYGRLAAARGRNLIFGPGLLVAGPASLYQGLLATVLERYASACRHFERALGMCERMGWLPLGAWTRCAYASTLLQAGGRRHAGRAERLLGEAARAADALGLGRIASEVAALRARSADRTERARSRAPRPSSRYGWILSFGVNGLVVLG